MSRMLSEILAYMTQRISISQPKSLKNKKNKARNFENPHRCRPVTETVHVFTELTPGLGRRIPELLREDGNLFEIHYANIYDRRVEWLYSPHYIHVYRKIRSQNNTSTPTIDEATDMNQEIFTFEFPSSDVDGHSREVSPSSVP